MYMHFNFQIIVKEWDLENNARATSFNTESRKLPNGDILLKQSQEFRNILFFFFLVLC